MDADRAAVYDVLEAAAIGGKPSADAVKNLRAAADARRENGDPDVPELASDSLWVLWTMADPHVGEGEAPAKSTKAKRGDGESIRKRVVELARGLIEAGVLNNRVLAESGELDFLEAVGILPRADLFRKKEVKFNTRTQYLQSRFNLMREESEGFAKVIALAAQLRKPDINWPPFIDMMEKLIGGFLLDPHRVLCIIVDALPADNFNGSFEVLRRFNRDHLADLLGFKLQHCHGRSHKGRTPPELLRKVAKMVQQGFVGMFHVGRYLQPTAAQWTEQTDKWLAAITKEANAVTESRSGSQSDTGPPQGKRKGTGLGDLEIDAGVMGAKAQGLLALDNQLLGLLAELLDLGELDAVLRVVDGMGGVGGWADAAYPPFRQALCSAINKLVLPVYEKLIQGPSELGSVYLMENGRREQWPKKPLGSALDRRAYLLLECLGLYIKADPQLFDKVCRVMKHETVYFGGECSKQVPGEVEMLKPDTVESVLAHVLLPGLMLMPGNVAKAWEVQDVMAELDWEHRSIVYSCFETTVDCVPLLDLSDRLAEAAVGQVLRRVSRPHDSRREHREGARQLARRLSHVAASAPFSVAWEVTGSAEANRSLHEAYVDALQYCPDILFGALVHCICYRFLDGRKVFDGEHAFAPWLQNLARFAGLLCKAYPSRVDVSALLHLIITGLRAGDLRVLPIVTEIFRSMGGVEPVMDLGDSELEPTMGSRVLRSVAAMQGNHVPVVGYSGREASRLLAALTEGSPGHHPGPLLLILLSRAQRWSAAEPAAADVQRVMAWTDAAAAAADQAVDFLSGAMTHQAYRAMLPPMEDLVNLHGLDPASAFRIWRPALQLAEGAEPEDGEIENGSKAGAPGAEAQGPFGEAIRAVERFKCLRDSGFWEAMPSEMYAMFWSLSVGDLTCPGEKYEAEGARLQAVLKTKESSLRILDRSRSSTRDQISTLDREIKTLRECQERLKADAVQQQKRVEGVKEQLQKSALMSSKRSEWKKFFTVAFLQYCLLPRIKCGPADGLYCYHFIMLVHELGLPFFHTVLILNRVLKEVTLCMATMTGREAVGLGLMLAKLLVKIERWREQEQAYTVECMALPGFLNSLASEGPKVSWEDYLKLNYKWHNRLGKLLMDFIAAGHYTMRSNALVVATKIVKVFPMLRGVSKLLKTAAEDAQNKDSRSDIVSLAGRYLHQLEVALAVPGRIVELAQYGGCPKERLTTVSRKSGDASTGHKSRSATSPTGEGEAPSHSARTRGTPSKADRKRPKEDGVKEEGAEEPQKRRPRRSEGGSTHRGSREGRS
eukprot:evm.model.scf_729.4 EVM.evm.TU.scf_729.4   scf_729:52172-68057(-)